MKILVTSLICFISSLCFSQTKGQAKQTTNPKMPAKFAEVKKTNADKHGEMKTYYMVFLVKGDKRDQDSITAAKIQEGHMAHLTKMGKEGKMDVAGPFMDDEDVRGICIYNVATLEEAKTLAESDPAVKSGRLKVVVRPWYSMKGAALR